VKTIRQPAAIAATLALLAPGAALAQGGSTCQAYNSNNCQIAPGGGTTGANTGTTGANTGTTGANTGNTTAATNVSLGSSLPFTGLDAALLGAGGLTFAGIGFAVRRIATRSE
jgi:hypothetical protein